MKKLTVASARTTVDSPRSEAAGSFDSLAAAELVCRSLTIRSRASSDLVESRIDSKSRSNPILSSLRLANWLLLRVLKGVTSLIEMK